MSDSVAFVCGGDVASHRFPLFRCEAKHTSVRGELLLIPVTAWRGCVEDPSTQVIVADRRACGFFLRVHAETEALRCMAKWRGSVA